MRDMSPRVMFSEFWSKCAPAYLQDKTVAKEVAVLCACVQYYCPWSSRAIMCLMHLRRLLMGHHVHQIDAGTPEVPGAPLEVESCRGSGSEPTLQRMQCGPSWGHGHTQRPSPRTTRPQTLRSSWRPRRWQPRMSAPLSSRSLPLHPMLLTLLGPAEPLQTLMLTWWHALKAIDRSR